MLQRTAILLCGTVLALSGCAQKRVEVRSLPAPLTATRSAPRHILVPPPLPLPREQPAKVAPGDYLAAAEGPLIPRRGIARSKWKVIVVHHSANRDDTPASMHAYHLRQRGWSNGLGYHFVIGNGANYGDGRIFVGPRWRKQLTGAHCKAKAGRYFGAYRSSNFFNEHGIGICLIGNFENSKPTARQMAALKQLVQFLSSQTGISPAAVYGHGQVTGRTQCPGRALAAKLPQVRSAVARAVSYRAPSTPEALDSRLPADSRKPRAAAITAAR